MDFWRKILILAIIFLFSYILWRLLLKRKEILLEQSRQTIENFTPASNAVSISSINVNSLTATNGITDPMTAKQLKQFVIKASYHTCYTGSDLSASMVTYALNRGYRWLDFCIADGINVCYSKDDITADSITTIQFGDVASKIAMHGFISPDSPNSKDPLFIQIRFLNTDISNTTILNNIIKGFSDKNIPVYTGIIDKNTTIDQLLGKVVFVINKTQISKDDQNDYTIDSILHNNDNTFMTSLPISKAGNLKAPIPLTLADNFTTTPPDKIYQFFPTGATGNSDVYSTIQSIGAQITPMCIWANDTHLANYETIFNSSNAGIVPLSAVLKYTKTNNPNVISSSYPGAFSGK